MPESRNVFYNSAGTATISPSRRCPLGKLLLCLFAMLGGIICSGHPACAEGIKGNGIAGSTPIAGGIQVPTHQDKLLLALARYVDFNLDLGVEDALTGWNGSHTPAPSMQLPLSPMIAHWAGAESSGTVPGSFKTSIATNIHRIQIAFKWRW